MSKLIRTLAALATAATLVIGTGVGIAGATDDPSAPTSTVPVVVCVFVNSKFRPDAQIAKAIDGPYGGDGVYADSVIAPQMKGRTVKKGGRVRLAVRLQNDSLSADTLRVRAVTSGKPGFAVAYFQGTTDITNQVKLGTYTTGVLQPGQNKYITVRFIALSTSKYLGLRNADFTIRSANEPTAKDVVRARAVRV